MRLRVTKLGSGPGPREVVISVTTSTGEKEEVVVDQRALDQSMIEVGHPIYSNDEKSLIELPRESMSGRWRLWVPTESVLEN